MKEGLSEEDGLGTPKEGVMSELHDTRSENERFEAEVYGAW